MRTREAGAHGAIDAKVARWQQLDDVAADCCDALDEQIARSQTTPRALHLAGNGRRGGQQETAGDGRWGQLGGATTVGMLGARVEGGAR